ncbi:MAG: MBL fold metallo-hydrolase [bacterium]
MSTSESAPPAHHAPGGGFRNPWPDSEPHGFGALLRWAGERRGQRRSPTPAPGSFPTATPRIAHPRAAAPERSATWIGHSTVLLQMSGLNVLTDPVWSDRASPLKWIGPKRIMTPALPLAGLPPLDVILISHSHYDHLDKRTVRQLAREHANAAWIVPLRLGQLLRDWGARTIIELDWWQSASVKSMQITATPARHFSARGINDRNETLWCGYAIAAGEHRAYFAGDSAYHPDFAQIASRCGPFDFVMMPIGAYDPRWFMHIVHMDPEEAVQAYLDLVAANEPQHLPVMLGIHWGTFRLTDEPMDEPPRRAAACWQQHGMAEDNLWIASFGETRAW